MSSKDNNELLGKTIYVLFQESTPIEVCSHPARAVARAKEWSTSNRPCTVAGVKVEYVFGSDKAASGNGGMPEADGGDDHAGTCGLGADCPRQGDLAGGSLSVGVKPLTQMEFDFSDEEPTWPTCQSHGKSSDGETPDDPDCPCRGGKGQAECAYQGCGFCAAAEYHKNGEGTVEGCACCFP